MKSIPFQVGDDVYKLRYTFNSLCDLEELTGKPIDKLWGISSIRYLLWASLIWQNQNLTIKKAGNIIQKHLENGGEPSDVLDKCLEALNDSGFGGKEGDEENF